MKKKNTALYILLLLVIVSFLGYQYYIKQKSQNVSTGNLQSGEKVVDAQLKVFVPPVLMKGESQELILYTGENAKIVETSLSTEKLNFHIKLEDFNELENSKFDVAILTPFDFIDYIEKFPKTSTIGEMTQCHYQVKVLVPQDSTITDLKGLSGKVVGTVVSSYPKLYLTLKPFEIDSIYPSKILKFSANPAGIKALQSKQVDAYSITQRIDPKTPSFDINSKDKGLKEIYVSKYYIPCRIVVAKEGVNAEVLERVTFKLFTERDTTEFKNAIGMHDSELSNKESLEKIKKELNWTRDPKIQAMMEDAPL